MNKPYSCGDKMKKSNLSILILKIYLNPHLLHPFKTKTRPFLTGLLYFLLQSKTSLDDEVCDAHSRIELGSLTQQFLAVAS